MSEARQTELLEAINTILASTGIAITTALPAGTNNIGDVDLASAIPAGDNNIGNVDIATLPGTVQTDIAAMKGKIDTMQADIALIKAGTPVSAALPAGINNIGDVDIASIAAGDNNIGNVDIASIAAGDNNIGNVDIVTLPGSVESDIGDIKTAVEAATPAGENHIGEVGGNSTVIEVTPTITAGGYSINDIVGGKQTLANVLRTAGKYAILQDLAIIDKEQQNAPLEILLFKADLAGTYSDNDAEAISAADALLCIARIQVLASDYVSFANFSQVNIPSIGKLVYATSGTTLYALIKVGTAPTYASTSDLKLFFGFLRD